MEFIVRHPSCCVAESFIFVVGLQLFYMCDVNYSVLLLRISFRIYTCPGVCHAIEKDNAEWGEFHSVTELFIPLWKLSFLHMC